MLRRENYYELKQREIKDIIVVMINDLIEMTEYYTSFLKSPSDEKIEFLAKTEKYVDKNEKQVEKYILEMISLQQLNVGDIKWLLAMTRTIRELERVGDQITNIVTISDVDERKALSPLISDFFQFIQQMMKWLVEGIIEDDTALLKKVIDHDQHVNQLDQETFQNVVTMIEKDEPITESNLKMILISRFLERVGDNLANVAKTYKKVID